MKSIRYVITLIGISWLASAAACTGANNQVNGNSERDSVSLPSPETEKPNTDYKPAFPNQTRAPGIKTKTALDVKVINEDLNNPWAICPLPNGQLLITENKGNLRIVNIDGTSQKKIDGLPVVAPQGQGGLLDVIIDPQFTENNLIYWTYSEAQHEGKTILAIAKGILSINDSKVLKPQVIYRATPAHKGVLQYGSRLVFDREGNLFVSTGERSDKEIRVQAQELNSALGKILHITTDGKPVANGPFANTANALPEIYAYGLRNPDGLAWNPITGELWEAEFGPRGGDEINIIRAGRNYGWPVISYGIEYNGQKVGAGLQQKEGMEQPVYYWDPVISPGDMIFYSGTMIPEWKNNLFVAGLSSNYIARLVIKDNKVVAEERFLKDRGERFRALAVGQDGALYAATDSGKLYRSAKK